MPSSVSPASSAASADSHTRSRHVAESVALSPALRTSHVTVMGWPEVTPGGAVTETTSRSAKGEVSAMARAALVLFARVSGSVTAAAGSVTTARRNAPSSRGGSATESAAS